MAVCFCEGIITGNYDEDFEAYESVDSSYLSENDPSFLSSSDSESCESLTASEVEEEPIVEKVPSRNSFVLDRLVVMFFSTFQMSRKPAPRQQGKRNVGDLTAEAKRYKICKQRRREGLEGQGGEQLMLSVKDVRKLRQSLELNETIKRSIFKQRNRGISVSN